ncbi:MAG: bifunctional oligoribonuclease/PAP phosphatase NrnA [Anaerolineales bacterium]|nr:bifunctional oligoribonuclease/PAP phosphatase NrnA [Anaerolineales bacterium]
MSEQVLAEIRQCIAQAQHIAVVGHKRPDGDSIGSVLGLGLALQNAGKQVQMCSADGVPTALKHLEGSDQIVQELQLPIDLVIAVDMSSFDRLGADLPEELVTARTQAGLPLVDVCIDHHATNNHFAAVSLVEETEVAVAAILTKYLPALGLEISAAVAGALLTGIITDTIGFRTPNVNAGTLRLAADLVEKGADLPELYFKALVEKSFEATRYWGAGLSKIHRENGIVWTTLSVEDRKMAGYGGNDDADLVNELSSVKDAKIAIIFIEQTDNTVKISWRSKPGFDVSQIATQFGGGGHKVASGALAVGDLQSVCEQVLAATRQTLTDH